MKSKCTKERLTAEKLLAPFFALLRGLRPSSDFAGPLSTFGVGGRGATSDRGDEDADTTMRRGRADMEGFGGSGLEVAMAEEEKVPEHGPPT